MRIEKRKTQNPKSAIRNPNGQVDAFFRATPLHPGHKAAFLQEIESQKLGGQEAFGIDPGNSFSYTWPVDQGEK